MSFQGCTRDYYEYPSIPFTSRIIDMAHTAPILSQSTFVPLYLETLLRLEIV